MIDLFIKILEPFERKDAESEEKLIAIVKIGIVCSIVFLVGDLTGRIIKHFFSGILF